MPIPDHIRKTVLFIGVNDALEKFQPRATAFVVSAAELDLRLGFFVTADHVVSNLLGLSQCEKTHGFSGC